MDADTHIAARNTPTNELGVEDPGSTDPGSIDPGSIALESIDPGAIELAAEVMRLLSDTTRIRIVLSLHGAGELSVNEIAKRVGKSPSGVSQHLARLRLARMVTTRQEGTSVHYRLLDEHAILLVAEALKQAEHAVATGQLPPHHHVRSEHSAGAATAHDSALAAAADSAAR